MATNTTARPNEKRTGTESIDTIPGAPIGVDGHGDRHVWNVSEQTVVVEDGDGVERFPLAETPYTTLSEWAAHVANKRGLWQTLQMDVGVRERLEA